MLDEVQELVDALAEELRRPVGVDDRRLRAVAYSSHEDEIDAVRRRSILGRQAPAAVGAWLESLRIATARECVEVPANPELGMVGRLCIPLRFHDRLQGFLWLVEAEPPMSPAELDLARRRAEQLAEVLFLHQHERNTERAREADFVHQLLLDQAGQAAAAWPIERTEVYGVAVVAVGRPFEQFEGDVSACVTDALEQSRRRTAPHAQASRVEADRAIVVLACGSVDELESRVTVLTEVIEAHVRRTTADAVVVGLGGACADLGAIPVAHEQALVAVRIAGRVETVASPACWSSLSGYALPASLLGERDGRALIPAALQRLLDSPDGDALVAALAAYLDHAGDAKHAAAELFMHRSTLYHRLARIEQIAGVDLRSGDTRLELHLGIKLWQLTGAATSVAVPERDLRQPHDDERRMRA